MSKKPLSPEQWEGVVNAVGRHTGIDYDALSFELGSAFSECFDDFNDFDDQLMLRDLPIKKRGNLYFVQQHNGDGK